MKILHGTILGLLLLFQNQWTMPQHVVVPTSAVVAPTYIQSCNSFTGSSSSTATCTFGSAVTPGHLLRFCISQAITTATTVTFSDTGTFVNDLPLKAFGTYSAACYYTLSAGGGETSVTLTMTHTQYYGVVGDEYNCPSCVFDTAGSGATGTSTTPTSDSITTAKNGELVVGYTATSNSSTAISAGSGFTLGASSGFKSANEYEIQSTAGSIAATFSLTISRGWIAYAAAFHQ